MSAWAVSGRILWKEYRHQRAFWLGLLVLGVALQGLLWVLMDPGKDRTAALVRLVFGFPACYMVGSLAMLFAGESEAGTAAFLRNVAAPRWPLVLTKLAFAALSALGMSALLLLAALLIAGAAAFTYLPTGGVFAAAVAAGLFAFGWMWSMVSSRPFDAICWTLASVIISAVLAAGVQTEAVYLSSMVAYLGVIAVVLAVSVGLVGRWGEPSDFRIAPRDVLARLTARRRARLWQAADEPAGWRRTWRRLKWKERRAAGLTWWLLGVGLVVVLVGVSWERHLDVPFALGFIAFIPALLGIASYQGEHARPRYGFLTDHAISPAALWLAKQRVWLPRAVLLPTVLAAVYAFGNGETNGPDSAFIIRIALWSLLAYGIGQTLALLIPQSAVAVVVGILVLTLAGFWWAEMLFLRVPLGWAAPPVAAWLLLVTLVRLPDWLDPHRGWWSRIRLAAVLAVPPVLLAACYAQYRVDEVPRTPAPPPLAELLQPQTAEDREVDRMLRRAEDLQLSTTYNRLDVNWVAEQDITRGWDQATAWQRQSLELNEEALDLLIRAADRDEAVLQERPNTPDEWREERRYSLDTTANLLLFSARKLEAEGELNPALERYLSALRLMRFAAVNGGFDGLWLRNRTYQAEVLRWLPGWASHPDQTPGRIRDGIARVAAELDRYPDPMTALALDYYAGRRYLEESPREIADDAYDQEGALGELRAELTAHWFPWERERAERVLRHEWNVIAHNLSMAMPGLRHPGYDLQRVVANEWGDANDLFRYREVQRTPLDVADDLPHWPVGWLGMFAERERATLLTLELIAWRLEHGRLPERLEELVGHVSMLRLIDPWSGRLFQYAPNGLPTPLAEEAAKAQDAVGRPVLWSIGENALRLVPVEMPGGMAYTFADPGGYTPQRPTGTVDTVAVPNFHFIPQGT